MNPPSPSDLANRAGGDPDQEVSDAVQRIETLVADLENLTNVATAQHVEVYESVQQVLSDTLSTVDEA